MSFLCPCFVSFSSCFPQLFFSIQLFLLLVKLFLSCLVIYSPLLIHKWCLILSTSSLCYFIFQYLYFYISILVVIAFSFLIIILLSCLSFPSLSSLLNSFLFFVLSCTCPVITTIPHCLDLFVSLFLSSADFILLILFV